MRAGPRSRLGLGWAAGSMPACPGRCRSTYLPQQRRRALAVSPCMLTCRPAASGAGTNGMASQHVHASASSVSAAAAAGVVWYGSGDVIDCWLSELAKPDASAGVQPSGTAVAAAARTA